MTTKEISLLEDILKAITGLGDEVKAVAREVEALNRRMAALEPEQAWYWSAEWQAWEQEADENLAAGDYEEFETVDEFVASLSPTGYEA